jgi:hypothetical protein
MAEGETPFTDILSQARAFKTTIVHLGNHLGYASYNEKSTDDALIQTAAMLKERNCNMVLIRGRYDNPHFWEEMSGTIYEGCIMFVDSFRVIDDCAFLGGGVPMLQSFRDTVSTLQKDSDCLALPRASFMGNLGITRVFSSIPPVHLLPASEWKLYFNSKGVYDRDLINVLYTELVQMWLNYEVLSYGKKQNIVSWHFQEFQEREETMSYKNTLFINLGYDDYNFIR